MVNIFLKIRQLIIKHKLFFLYPFYRLIGLLYGASIPLNSIIGNNIKFKHGLYGIFISGEAIIEDNVTIYQHVTIGSKFNKKLNAYSAPVIGEGTILYPGCKLVGSIKIGKNCKIGPNVVVWFDVPDNITVVFDKSSLRLFS